MEFIAKYVNSSDQGISKLVTESHQTQFPVTVNLVLLAIVLDRELNRHLVEGFQITIGAVNILSGSIKLTGETGPIIFDFDEEETEVVIPQPLNPPVQTVQFESPEEDLTFNFEDLQDQPLEVYGDIQIFYSID